MSGPVSGTRAPGTEPAGPAVASGTAAAETATAETAAPETAAPGTALLQTAAPGTDSGATGATGATGAPGTPTTAAPPAPVKLAPDTVAALQSVLAATHAALWAYGLVAAESPDDARTISDMLNNHQILLDTVANLLVMGGATPAGPAPAYSTPMPVTDPASARALALVIESDCAAAWRVVIGSTDDSALRGTALTGLTDSALRILTWKQLAAIKPLTVPFPGTPTKS